MSDSLQIRAGDLTAEHIGHDAGDGPIMAIHHYIEAGKHSVDIISVRGVRQWHSAKILTLSPPAPIRRRITWESLENVTIAQMANVTVVDGSEGWPSKSLVLCVSWLCFDDTRSVVIEVPQGHALSQAGEGV
jgi:hypothetical protein